MIRRFPTKEAAGIALAETVAPTLQTAIALPGGRSPLPFFDALFAQKLDWGRLQITLTDDRWVEATSPDSNEGLVARHLAGTPAAAAQFIGLKTAAPSPEAGLAELSTRLKALPDLFDAVILGLGDDGHIASLFPGGSLNPPEGGPCLPGLAPVAPFARISLSLERLLATRSLFLLFGGEHRLGLVKERPAGLPVTELLARAGQAVEVFYYES